MAKWFLTLLLLGMLIPVIGCEAEGRVDDDADDDASLKVDVDD